MIQLTTLLSRVMPNKTLTIITIAFATARRGLLRKTQS